MHRFCMYSNHQRHLIWQYTSGNKKIRVEWKRTTATVCQGETVHATLILDSPAGRNQVGPLLRGGFLWMQESRRTVAYMCLFMWRAKWSEREKARSQRWHWKGLCPVCFLKWRVNSSDLANFQPHPSQLQW